LEGRVREADTGVEAQDSPTLRARALPQVADVAGDLVATCLLSIDGIAAAVGEEIIDRPGIGVDRVRGQSQ